MTQFAFPCKSATYVCAGAKILAVCGEENSVARWAQSNRVGCVVRPEMDGLIEFFRQVEQGALQLPVDLMAQAQLKKKLSMNAFVSKLDVIVFGAAA